jgi:hypothetical protein
VHADAIKIARARDDEAFDAHRSRLLNIMESKAAILTAAPGGKRGGRGLDCCHAHYQVI